MGIFSKFSTNVFFVFLREQVFPEEDEKYISWKYSHFILLCWILRFYFIMISRLTNQYIYDSRCWWTWWWSPSCMCGASWTRTWSCRSGSARSSRPCTCPGCCWPSTSLWAAGECSVFVLFSICSQYVMFSICFLRLGRWLAGGGGCTCLHIRSVNFFCFLKNSILQFGIVEYLKVWQNCHRVESHYFKFIHDLKKYSSVRFDCTAL